LVVLEKREKEFKLGTRQYEEYTGVRFGNGDCALLVGVCCIEWMKIPQV
jgi:hypothetical protein